MPIYYIGFIDNNKLPFNYELSNTVTVQAVRNKDCLSPYIWKYFGERITTKKELKKNRAKLLQEINNSYGTNFERIVIK